MYLVIVMSKAA